MDPKLSMTLPGAETKPGTRPEWPWRSATTTAVAQENLEDLVQGADTANLQSHNAAAAARKNCRSRRRATASRRDR